jgi:hypothetical protein
MQTTCKTIVSLEVAPEHLLRSDAVSPCLKAGVLATFGSDKSTIPHVCPTLLEGV